jgi:hypothetical protein
MMADETDEETTAIEAMLDSIQSKYPSLIRNELRQIFHETYDRLVKEEEQ